MSTSDLTPTVVLVHGAFVDASSWNGAIAELKAAGLDVVAPPNLLRGVGVDAAYLTGFVEALGRPAVLAAHSYAGAVISQTGSDASNIAGLVYIAAYAPEAGETLGAINARYPDVPLSAALRTFTYADERGEQATDTFVDARSFHDAVCAEAPADVADTLARTQRPASLAASRRPSPARRHGRPCRPGPSWPPPITPSTRTPSATWPSGRAARSPRSTPRTRSRPRIPRTWPRSSSARSRPSDEPTGRGAVRSSAADRRRRARCRLRQHRAARRPGRAAAPRMALRHPQLR